MNVSHGVWILFQVVVDVRNSYEIRVGKFKRAVDPLTDSFRQFPAWVEENLGDGGESGKPSGLDGSQVVVEEEEHARVSDQEVAQSSCEESAAEPRSPRRIAMYCTGGIRCEKATSYLVNQGFDEVRALSHLGTICEWDSYFDVFRSFLHKRTDCSRFSVSLG